MVIPLVYCIAAQQIASSMQLKKEEIKDNDSYVFQSNWKVFGIGALTLIIFLAIALAIMLGMEAIGILSLA